MTDSRLQHLQNTVPPWFVLGTVSASSLVGIARVPGTDWQDEGVRLLIKAGWSLQAQEEQPGQCFPARCPERHVQSDQTFCLGLRRLDVTDDDVARQWWEQLRQYIRCQSTAEQTGIWPPMHALDHGDAGEHHEKALALAEELNIQDEYAAAYLDEPSWITDHSLRLLGKGDKPLNGRMACPRGCRHARRPSRPILRRKCKRRAQLVALVIAERKRRNALADYWREAAAGGAVCCGRMRSCEFPAPLKAEDANAEAPIVAAAERVA